MIADTISPKTCEPRRIVLLSDGTGNSAAKLFRTNVWRLYQALDLRGAEQVARYDDGVGTSKVKPFALIAGAIGWGLKRNLLELYMFLCRNYRKGDDIYAFGFSRGAFTIRVLMKFALSEGLITDFYSDDDLRWKSKQLYRNFRRQRKTTFGLATAGRAVRDVSVWMFSLLFRSPNQKIKTVKLSNIKFVGVWDTVDAYGLPIYELKKGIDKYIWPLALEDRTLDVRIDKACHAICLDDFRKTFHPILWNEKDLGSASSTDDQKLTQVFFSGTHSNVGGGYPDDGVSYVSLNWMMKEAHKSGLHFLPAAVEVIEGNSAPLGRLYDSRSGLGTFYRYEPRRMDPPRDVQGNSINAPKIHESVLLRMAIGTDAYAPVSIPLNFKLLVEDSWKSINSAKSLKNNLLDFDTYMKEAPFNGATFNELQTACKAAKFSDISIPSKKDSEIILDTIWWRRLAYVATTLLTIGLFLSPWVSLLDKFLERISAALGMDVVAKLFQIIMLPPIGFVASIAETVAPTIFKLWVGAFRDNPVNFATLFTLILASISWGKLIDRRIHDRAYAAFNSRWSEQRIKWFRESLRWRRKATYAVSILCCATIGWMVWVTTTTPQCQRIACSLQQFYDEILRTRLSVLLIVILIITQFTYLKIHRLMKSDWHNIKEPRGISLTISHKIRTSVIAKKAAYFFEAQLVPAGFALIIFILSTILISRALFASFFASGFACVSSSTDLEWYDPYPPVEKIIVLDYSNLCQPTGLWLRSDSTYEISPVSDSNYEIKGVMGQPQENEDDRERERSEKAEARRRLSGLPLNTPQSFYGTMESIALIPFRQILWDPWGSIQARVGGTGFEVARVDEFPLVLTPKNGGELFLFSNDAVFGTYAFKHYGKQKIQIRRISRP